LSEVVGPPAQAPLASHVSSLVHTFESEQAAPTAIVPAQVPAEVQASPVVHGFLSLQAAPVMPVWTQALPFQESAVHGFASSQFVGTWHSHGPQVVP
jgi:hypothetical protein